MGTLLVSGGAGFIGSNLVRHALAHAADRIVVVDKLTYAGSLSNLEEPLKDARVSFTQADIADRDAMEALFRATRPTSVLNLAAESHVDRSTCVSAARFRTASGRCSANTRVIASRSAMSPRTKVTRESFSGASRFSRLPA